MREVSQILWPVYEMIKSIVLIFSVVILFGYWPQIKIKIYSEISSKTGSFVILHFLQYSNWIESFVKIKEFRSYVLIRFK